MPKLLDNGLEAIKTSDEPSASEVLRAVQVGCTDAEIAGLMGITEAELHKLIDSDPVLSSRLASLRATRRFDLRSKVHEIATDDDHPAQGRILREILVGELQNEEESNQNNASTWQRLMDLARGGQ